MEFMDDKLNLFFDKNLLQQTVNACVDKGINLAEFRWFTQPENRITLAKQMLAGQYHIAPPHIIEIPKRDSAEMRKVYCNEAMDRFICAQMGRVYERMYGNYQKVPNDMLRRCGYISMVHLFKLYKISKSLYIGIGYSHQGCERRKHHKFLSLQYLAQNV